MHYDCNSCERHRREMAIMLEATKQWTKAPWGPGVQAIFLRLREEAKKQGDWPDE